MAVDHPRVKNLIGAFHQPSLVISDTGLLRTLPAREYRSGLAEVVKHGVIRDAAFFTRLEQSTSALLARDLNLLTEVVRRNCEIKAAVVGEDAREMGVRAILNFGHTIGHALESLTGYRTLRHGEAVALGMVAAARLSEVLGLCDPDVGDRLAALLTALRLPTRLPPLSSEDVIAALRSDKKAVSGVPRFVLPREIGRVEIVNQVPEAALREALQRYPLNTLRYPQEGTVLYDFHTHTFLSDGVLLPIELIRRAVVAGYTALGVTDHASAGNLKSVLDVLVAECRLAEKHWEIRALPGVELTHVPPEAIAELVQEARATGAQLVVVHGESPVEPVAPGTNLAAVSCPDVDLLAHPGLLTPEEADLAARHGVFLELTARGGHALGNGASPNWPAARAPNSS